MSSDGAKFGANFKNRFSSLSRPARIAVLAIGLLVSAAALFWLFNQTLYYLLAKNYADELSRAYNINRGFASALVWGSFAVIVLFAGFIFSFSKRKRAVGYLGILGLLIGHGVLLGMRDSTYDPRTGKTEKCYVISRDGIKILNHVGIDPDTGLECRILTPQMTEKYNAYRDGRRPQAVVDRDPTFFDPISGEPVVWYIKQKTGRIEIFDLMGFHPRTGDELKPINRQIVDEWRTQSATIVQRAPSRIDPDRSGFFDAVTGNAKVWYWIGASGYEFFDGPGFHPKTGDGLKIVTREAIESWRQAVEAAAERERKEQEREAVARQAAIDAQKLAQQQAAEELQRQQQAGLDCDRLAANPTDIRRKAEGATFDILRGQADPAIEACTKAVQQYPTETRYQYQLARAYQFRDKKKAFELLVTLVKASYPAAFDNLGGMYLGRDNDKALQIFLRGSELDDADSMVSLADLIDKGIYMPPNPMTTKLNLLKRAAELGHAGAQRGFPLELQKVQQMQVQQENQRQMLNFFGHVVGGALRR